jgi:diguanylate cyclase (GGDEF)-like protein/PAS domain S-box-containing protein
MPMTILDHGECVFSFVFAVVVEQKRNELPASCFARGDCSGIMFREAYLDDVEERIQTPEVREMLRIFQGCRAESGHAAFENFNLTSLWEKQGQLMLLAPNAEGDDFLYLHFGQAIASAMSYDMTGKHVSDLQPEMAEFTIAAYRAAIAGAKPVYTVHRAATATQVALWERLVMPVRNRSGQDFLIVFANVLRFREELLSAILESSENGIIALEAVRDVAHQVTDALIVTANRRACEICGFEQHQLIGASALERLPVLKLSAIWQHCVEAISDSKPGLLEASARINGRDHWFRVSLAPLRDGVAMTFADVTELKLANLALQSHAATLASQIGKERANAEALSTEVSRQKLQVTALRLMAETDPMTGLLNRRSFQARIGTVRAAAAGSAADFCLLIVDLDHFKRINDGFGHQAGDAAIRACANLLKARIQRQGDFVARIGGEEFAIVLANTKLEGALVLAEAVRERIEAAVVTLPDARVLNLTASIGAAQWLQGESTEDLFSRADEALYAAKGLGRNRVEIARRNGLANSRTRAA